MKAFSPIAASFSRGLFTTTPLTGIIYSFALEIDTNSQMNITSLEFSEEFAFVTAS